MVRITESVGTILGTDEREYSLMREDVVTLPAANAEALLSKDAAVEIE
jgi:DNA replication factor GINS